MRIKKLFSFFTALLLISSLFANIVFASELTVPENAAETESTLEIASAPGAENTGTSEQESEGTEAEPAADNSEGERNSESGNEADRNENPGNEAAEGDNNGNDAGDGEAAENENGSAENEAAPEAVLTEETETENTAAAEEKLTPYKPEEGVYTIATALDAGKLLDVPNGTKNPGVAIQILDKNDKDSQQFRLIKNSDGSYRIMSVNADKALEIKNESDEAGAGVVQNFKTAKSYQKWSFFKDNDGNVQIISNTVRKYCICVEKGKAVNKAKIRTAVPAAGNPKDQRFVFTLVRTAAEDKPEPVKEGVYLIRTGVDTNMVVDIAGAKKTAAANVQIYKYNGSDAQKFIVTQVGENAFTLTNVNSGRAIDTYEGKKTAATNVVQYALDGTSTQNWILEPADRGYYYLKNSGSGLYLDIKGAKRDNAANIQIYTGNRSDAQKFRFELVDEKRTMPDGLYIFHSRLNSQAVLDIRGASINNTANVQLYTSNDTNAQKFRVTYAGDGWYTILNDNSGKALDVKGAKNANSVNVQQYAANGTKAQKWRFAATDSYRVTYAYDDAGRSLIHQ